MRTRAHPRRRTIAPAAWCHEETRGLRWPPAHCQRITCAVLSLERQWADVGLDPSCPAGRLAHSERGHASWFSGALLCVIGRGQGAGRRRSACQRPWADPGAGETEGHRERGTHGKYTASLGRSVFAMQKKRAPLVPRAGSGVVRPMRAFAVPGDRNAWADACVLPFVWIRADTRGPEMVPFVHADVGLAVASTSRGARSHDGVQVSRDPRERRPSLEKSPLTN